MRRLSSLVVVATMFVSLFQGASPVAHAGAPPSRSYLALGDSLAAGFQPGPGVTRRGYVDDLWRRVERLRIPDLGLRNVGCPGETSLSMVTGNRSPCRYTAGSQLDAALAFIERHPGEVAFITIDIGTNDIFDRCLEGSGLLPRACVVDVIPRVQTRLVNILDTLAAAVGPGVPILSMTDYDPLLGLWILGSGGRELARADLRAWTVMNAGFATAYGDAGIAFADVAATFRIDDFMHTVVVPRLGRVPVNVALACHWTWFCSRRFFGDPHANRTGYQRIAGTFYRELRGLLL